MKFEIRLFGPAARRLGRESVRIDCTEPATTAKLRAQLAAAEPSLADLVAAGRLAVNHEYVSDAATLNAADEIALISMVSGG